MAGITVMASDLLSVPLTREQALAAAGVLVLAYADEVAAPPGGTIAQGAAAAVGGPKGAPKHVATAKGAQHFHAGIGGLIIPHGMHYVQGQPGHMIGNVSQAKWIANQWKDKDKASEAAEKAVYAGTHHWVQAGEHSYAVHNGLDVHIPKDVDVHDEAAVKNAPKVIVKHGEHPEHVMLSPDHAGEVQPHDKGAEHLLKTGYKKLPPQPAKKAVTFEGKHAAWVPHDWQVYHAKDVPEGKLGGKFAKDPQGQWHLITPSGIGATGTSGMHDDWVKNGQLVPDEHHAPEPEHVAPNQGAKGPEPAKVDIGGVAVTKDEIHSAIQHLQEDKSTAVKQPLAKKGHPLAAMAYHDVAKAELAAHPELKVPAGTKKAHVGQVKLAVLHHLAAQADKMAADEAHAKAAAEAAVKAEAAADHAQKLTPATFDIGGVTATKGEIQAAIADLQMSKSTAIKQILKAKENPLAASDYWAVINEYKAAHAVEAKHGTKQAHAPNAKTWFIAALEEKSGHAAQEDKASGHDVAAQLDQIITAPGAHVKTGWSHSADGSLAAALLAAATGGKHAQYAYLSNVPGEWTISMVPPKVNYTYIKASPEHVLTMVLAGGKEDHDFTPEHTLEIAQQWITAKPQQPALAKVAELPPAESPAEEKVKQAAIAAAEKAAKAAAAEMAAEKAAKAEYAQALAEWKASPEYQVVDDLIKNHPPGVPPHDNKLDTDQQLAAILYIAGKQHKTWYLTAGTKGEWLANSYMPSGYSGTYGMPGKPWYAADENHQITAYDEHSEPTLLPGEMVAEIAKKWLTPKVPEPEPAKPVAGPDIPVIVGGENKGTVPAGSKFYKIADPNTPAAAASVYVKYPDGHWKWFGIKGSVVYMDTDTDHQDEQVANGYFVPAEQPLPVAGAPEKPPKSEAAAGLISVAGAVFPAGSKVYKYTTNEWPKLVKVPDDGSWHRVFSDGYAEEAQPALPGVYDTMVEKGKLEPVTAEGQPAAKPEPDILISVDGKPAGTVPAGSQIYVHKDFAGKPESANKFVKLPDGSWKTFWTDDGQPDTTSYPASKAGQLEAFVKNGTWVLYQPGGGKPEPEKASGTIPIWVAGMKAGEVPAGSEVYTGAKALNPVTAVKYIKQPDGSWVNFATNGSGTLTYKQTAPAGSKMAQDWQQMLAAGEFQAVSPEQLAAGEKPAAPAGEPVMVEAGGKTYQAPAGSKIYVWAADKAPAANFTPDNVKYVEEPDGSWKVIQSTGVTPLNPSTKDAVTSGKLILWTSGMGPSAETQAQDDLRKLLINGAVAASTQMSEGKANEDWVLVTTLAKVAKTGSQKWAVKQASGAWNSANYPPYPDDEYYHITSDLTVTHHSGGGEPVNTPVPPEKISALVHQLVTPDAVKIQVNGEYKILKHGFYYKPSKTAKSYLEIGPPPEGSVKGATYTYHAPSGSKDVNAVYAGKVLADATEYHAEQKGTVAAPLKVTHATVAKPGSYQSWSDVAKAPAQNYVIEVFSDGSMNVGTPGSLYPIPATSNPVDGLIKGGTLLDQYGTSVVKSGVTPDFYHVFGSKAMTPAYVKDLLSQFEHASGLGGYSKLMADTFPGDLADRALAFFGDKAAADTWQGQRDAVMALLRELLQVPGQSAAAVAEPVFLKSLPPGIHSAKDVFTWTDQGYAKPADLTLAYGLDSLSYANATLLGEYIKQVSDQFGDGKVVGTHISGLTKDQKSAWLQAWLNGDMTKVFVLDSAGGKVSPVHPGAPGNASTHHITWAPWDPSQIPASQVIEGNWTAPDVTMPQAEVANYLIKAGLQHGEYLSLASRRAWVKAHREHDQLAVDKLSKQAADAFSSGQQPVSEPLIWTDDLQPAKPYDIFLEDKTAATDWTIAALDSFIADSQAVLLPFAKQYQQESGLSGSPESVLESSGTWTRRKVVQKYLDDLKAKEAAEALKPVYALTPGAVAPKSSHPIYDLTSTIPATGNKTRWYFKPAPASEKFLAEQEHAAANLAHLWGFKTPGSQLIEFNGEYGQAQRRLEAVGDLSYGKPLGFYDQAPIPWNDLTPGQVSDIAREHLLDWALDNDDGRASNFLRMPDGAITGIDKGRAWANFGHWAGLSGDHHADERSAQVVTQLYSAVRGHQISQDTADAAYTAVIQRARRMARLSDAQMRTVLEQAFANRTSFGIPGSKDALIQAAIDRKNSLEKDFQDLWQRVYSDAGWQLPEVPEQKLPALPDGTVLHSGFTDPDFTDHVKASKSYGVPAFFGGTELDGSHVLVWHEYRGSGTDHEVIMGEAAARGAALDKIIAWAKAHLPAGGGGYESQFGDVGNVKGEKDFYDKIIAAAKTVSHHAADKAFNQAKLDGLAQAKAELESRLSYAENMHDLQQSLKVNWVKLYGDPQGNIAMAKYYLDLVNRVEKARDTGGTFSAGQLPRWEPPHAPEDDQPEVKVQAVSPQRHLTTGWYEDGINNALNPATGELHTKEAASSSSEGGTIYQVILPTGEVIEIGDSEASGVPLAQHGRIRFEAVVADGAASLERIRAQLQAMGLAMNDATEQDLQLYYWRHLAHILADRADSNTGKHGQVWDELKNQASAAKLEWNSADQRASVEGLASLAPEQELAIWHAAWAKLTSEEQVAQWVSRGGYLPRLKHFDIRDPSRVGGKPDWYRFDITPEMMASWQMPVHSFQSDTSEDAVRVLHAGGLFSKEARIRALGLKVEGMDNPASSGATGFVFTRLNMQDDSYGHVYFTPKILARTTNYGWDSDQYGKLQYRKTSAYFDPAEAASWTSSGNETMVADALSLLDDVEILRAYTEEQRQKLISELLQAGIDVIRGIPVSKRIVTQAGPGLIAEIRATYAEHPELLDPLQEAGIA